MVGEAHSATVGKKRGTHLSISTQPKFLIYALVDPRDGSIRYVGKSTQGLTRPRRHISRADQAGTKKVAWLRSLSIVGVQPQISVLEVLPSEDGLAEREISWIAAGLNVYGWPLTNMTAGGEGMLGYRFSEESREKMAAAKRGRKRSAESVERSAAGHRGKARPRDAVERSAAALRGRKIDPAIVEKGAAKNRGRRHSPETISKMRAWHQANRPKAAQR